MIRVRHHKKHNRVAISTLPGMWCVIVDGTISYWQPDEDIFDNEWLELFVEELPQPDGENEFDEPSWSTSFGTVSVAGGQVFLNGVSVKDVSYDALKLLAATVAAEDQENYS